MKKILSITLVAATFSGMAVASDDLAKAKNCTTCHSAERKIVGPSYKEIVAKRAGEKGAEAAIAAKIKNGSKGDWGLAPMPPNAVTDAEASALAKWVLNHK